MTRDNPLGNVCSPSELDKYRRFGIVKKCAVENW